MRRLALLILVICTGCSTAPLAGFLDTVAPAKPRFDRDLTPTSPRDPFFNPPPGTGPSTVPPVTIPPTSSGSAPPAFSPPSGPPPVTTDPPSPWAPRTPLLPNT